MQEVALRCRCGEVEGVLAMSPTPRRLVCYCSDCRAFAEWLGSDGLVDANGGADICQTTPAQIRFTKGRENLKLAKLTKKGAHRWYTTCCRVPAGNLIPNPKMPFVGLSVEMLARPDDVGPIQLRGMGKEAIGDTSQLDAHPKWPVGMLVGVIGGMMWRRMRGLYKPSEYFGEDGRPRVKPEVINP